jgi:purine-binding chemotaxis protein CheW
MQAKPSVGLKARLMMMNGKSFKVGASMAIIDSTDEEHDAQTNLRQFLSFSLAKEDYGIDILRVQEIRGWEEVREIPDTPDYIKGVLNLRNIVVPIIDLRLRFSQQNVEYKTTTVIVVLTVETGDKPRTVGVVVDAVSDVLDVYVNDIQLAPDFGSRVNTKYISGMVMRDDVMVILLDTDKLLNPDELATLETLTH